MTSPPEEAELFFGRDRDVEALAARVRAQPVVVVVGPSGVGSPPWSRPASCPGSALRLGRWSLSAPARTLAPLATGLLGAPARRR
ncbi:MAG: hypothetical protein M3133_04880 [Actinomycetota bacterium]|nr:hypothetical protein [Actinomycetota bacterium]